MFDSSCSSPNTDSAFVLVVTQTTSSQGNPTAPAAAPTMTQPRGVADLPIIGTKGSPRKFKGRADEVEDFLRHYERLCTKYQITADNERVESITQYCSRQVREFLEGLRSYRTPNWAQFRKDFREFFNADLDERRFRIRDLVKFTDKSRHTNSIKALNVWRKYTRGFIRIAGWLRKKNKISQEEYNTYFWLGIPRKFRERLEQRLMSQTPTHDIAQPFEYDSIEKVAKSLLQRDRFDRDRLPSDDSDMSDENEDVDNESDSESSSSSDSSTQSDDESSDDEYSHRKRKSARSKSRGRSREQKKKKVRFDKSDSEEDSDKELKRLYRKTKGRKKTSSKGSSKKEDPTGDEVEELISQLNRMSLNDPAYATTYFRACRLSPLVQQIVPSPLARQSRMSTNPVSGGRDLPPHMDRTTYDPKDQGPCWGCGESTHPSFNCPEMFELEQKRIVRRVGRRWTLPNGNPIPRHFNETMAKAAIRLHSPQAHFVALHSAFIESDEEDEQWMDDYYCMDQESQMVYESAYDSGDESDYEIYAAERPERISKIARKEKFDGVWVPARKKQLQKKAEATEKENEIPAPVPVPVPVKRKEFLKPAQTPVEVKKPVVIDPNDSDAFMDDNFGPAPVKRKQPAVKKDIPSPNKNPAIEREEGFRDRVPRISDLQLKTNWQGVMDKVLKAQVTMEVGEILGASKEMAHQVQEALKPKSRPATAERSTKTTAAHSVTMDADKATTLFARARGSLIRLRMECDGRPINAIIDTGSQLNIANREAWKGALARPMNITRKIEMHDANGGKGMLTGFVPNVPLQCGEVETHASIFIGERAPFDLLLGRPWQRGNYVSIDERRDGTYLLFKDKSLEVQYEILVTPEMHPHHDTEVDEYLASAHSGVFSSYMIATEPASPNIDQAVSPLGHSQDIQTEQLIERLEQLHIDREREREEEDIGPQRLPGSYNTTGAPQTAHAQDAENEHPMLVHARSLLEILRNDPTEQRHHQLINESRYWDRRFIAEPVGPFTILRPVPEAATELHEVVIPTPVLPQEIDIQWLLIRHERVTQEVHRGIEGAPATNHQHSASQSVQRWKHVLRCMGLTPWYTCPGCGEFGHVIWNCPRLQSFQRDGILVRDPRTRLLVIPIRLLARVAVFRGRRLKRRRINDPEEEISEERSHLEEQEGLMQAAHKECPPDSILQPIH